MQLADIFQSTHPRREVTQCRQQACDTINISIHTSPKGGDCAIYAKFRRVSISIHTSPKGGDDI